MGSANTAYDDRWMADVMTRMRLRDAAGQIEREFEAACPAISRREAERTLDRTLSNAEWARLSHWLRDEGPRRLLDAAADVIADEE